MLFVVNYNNHSLLLKIHLSSKQSKRWCILIVSILLKKILEQSAFGSWVIFKKYELI